MKARLIGLLALALLAAIIVTACGNNNEPETSYNNSTNNESTSNTDNTNDANSSNSAAAESKSWEASPEMTIDPDHNYEAIFHTSKGDFTAQLFAKETPITVNNFIFLSKQKYYDGVVFHRILQTFMIQTGDPTGTGGGGPGYTIQDELPIKEPYKKGILAMAKTMEPNSGGSQFFICSGTDCENLNQSPDYTVFGIVTSGIETVDSIAATPVEANPNTGEVSSPTEKVTIESIEIKE